VGRHVPKHARNDRRLQKGLAVSTAAFVLPVLGATLDPAYAAGGPSENASANAASGGAGGNGIGGGGGAGGATRGNDFDLGAGGNSETTPAQPGSQNNPNAVGNGANTPGGPFGTPTPDGGQQGNGNAPTNGSVGNADAKNPPALMRLVQQGAKLHAYPKDVMLAARRAAFEIYAEESGKNPAFKTLYDSWKPFRDAQIQWFKIAEAPYQNFLYYVK